MQLAFSQKVYLDNLALLQGDISKKSLGCIIIFDPESIYWLTGYRSIGYFTFQCVLILPDGKPIMISRQVNHAIALANANIAEFVAIEDTQDPVDILVKVLNQRISQGSLIGLETESTYLNVRSYKRLDAAMQGRLVDWGGVIEQARTIKTPEQLDFMRQAAKAAVAGLDAAVQAVKPGCTENDLAAAMLSGATKAGSEYTRVPLVVTGPATGVCFTTWERRQVQRGDVVFLEAAANINRYHAMIARNCIVGPATAEHKRFAQIVIDALDAAIAAIRPGVTSGSVDAACRSVFESNGLGQYFDHRTAYGIGIGFPPNWAEGRFLALKPDDETILQPGMTFHLVPSLFMPAFCFMSSESVAVTDDGCEVLTDYPRKLIELDF
ncbi:M24 family metallopeptidase [Aureimonas fodinaquatilis]|nr:Xaa-Pro peptidase family protein [Aureimonas fodinaquatilis]